MFYQVWDDPLMIETNAVAQEAEPNDSATAVACVTPAVTIVGRLEKNGDVDCIESAKIQYAVDLLGCDCRPAVRHVSAVLSPRQSEDLFFLLETRLD